MRGEPLPCFPLALVVAERPGARDEARGCRFWIGGLGEARAWSADGIGIPTLMPRWMVIDYEVPGPAPRPAPDDDNFSEESLSEETSP